MAIQFSGAITPLDVTKPAWCLASLGMDMGNSYGATAERLPAPAGLGGISEAITAIIYLMYFNPLLILQLLLDFSCLRKLPLDIAYMSELDPFAQSDELSLFAFPETLLFANPAAILACAADAIAATAGSPIDALFWCAGSWGQLYPRVRPRAGSRRELGDFCGFSGGKIPGTQPQGIAVLGY